EDPHTLLRAPAACSTTPLPGCRHAPGQSGEAGEVAVVRDPLAARLDGERREPGVRDPRAARIRLDAQAPEDRPMPLARLDDLAMGLAEQVIAEPEGFIDPARHLVGSWVGGDANERAECGRRDAERSIALDDAQQPAAALRMLRYILAESIDQDVDVRQDHFSRVIRAT